MFFDILMANDGDAFSFTTTDYSKLNANECTVCTHPGKGLYQIKENFKHLPSSYIVPKGSPLAVSAYT